MKCAAGQRQPRSKRSVPVVLSCVAILIWVQHMTHSRALCDWIEAYTSAPEPLVMFSVSVFVSDLLCGFRCGGRVCVDIYDIPTHIPVTHLRVWRLMHCVDTTYPRQRVSAFSTCVFGGYHSRLLSAVALLNTLAHAHLHRELLFRKIACRGHLACVINAKHQFERGGPQVQSPESLRIPARFLLVQQGIILKHRHLLVVKREAVLSAPCQARRAPRRNVTASRGAVTFLLGARPRFRF